MTTGTQSEQLSAMPYPSGWLGKFLFKAPLFLIRLGLQPLMGDRFLVITHTGRKSGLPRHTMTEMHPAQDGTIYAPCGYGDKAQWYKNIMADSRVTVQVAQRTFSAHARRVTDDQELINVVTLLIHRTPYFNAYLQRLGVENTPQSIIANKDKLYFIAFDETTDHTPPPLEADLQGLWIVLLGLLGVIWLIRRRNT